VKPAARKVAEYRLDLLKQQAGENDQTVGRQPRRERWRKLGQNVG